LIIGTKWSESRKALFFFDLQLSVLRRTRRALRDPLSPGTPNRPASRSSIAPFFSAFAFARPGLARSDVCLSERSEDMRQTPCWATPFLCIWATGISYSNTEREISFSLFPFLSLLSFTRPIRRVARQLGSCTRHVALCSHV